MISIATLFSGSSGNSTLVSSGNTHVLVDAGRNAKAVRLALEKLGLTTEDISAVFITHEHADHIKALEVICKHNPIPVHIAEESAICGLANMPNAYDCAVFHDKNGFSERVGELVVSSFPLPHDSKAHLGYVFEDDDGDSACVCTDMGYVTNLCADNITGVRQAVIEANHDLEMLINGSYPPPLKERIRGKGGHLDNEVSALLCAHLAKNGVENIILAHLSEENNTPEKALETVKNKLKEIGADKVNVKVASRYDVTAF